MSLTQQKDGALVQILVKGDPEAVTSATFDRVFLCTGPESNLKTTADPMIRNLLKRGLLRPGTLELGADPQCALPPIYMIDPLQREKLWEINVVRELRQEAKQLAERIIKDGFGPAWLP